MFKLNSIILGALSVICGSFVCSRAWTQETQEPANQTPPVAAESASDEVTRGLRRPTAQPLNLGKGKRYALIIGIDYSPAERVGQKGTVPALKQCEKEARELKDVLVGHYGYQEEHVKLLLGSEATRQAISSFLSDDFLCKQIQPEDSVLVYFAGHGAQHTSSNGIPDDKVYLWPVDVAAEGERKFSAATAVPLLEQIEYVSKHCAAKQKLIILDCCYSGAIFQGRTTPITDNDVTEKLTGTSIEIPVFQGISSTRAHETAVDTNSYTTALLKSLKRIHGRVPEHPQWNMKVFTASQLWRSSRVYLQNTGASQSPQCRWLDRNDGEFLFFPDSSKPIAEEQNTQAEQALLLAMVPSSFGNWWMDEIPWFMPGLRKAIIEQTDAPRGSVEAVPVPVLKQAAIKLYEGNVVENVTDNFHVNRGSYVKKRLAHMSLLLESTALSRRKAVMERIVAELQIEEKEGKLIPAEIAADMHFRAVLLHKLGKAKEAEQCYLLALKKYNELIDIEASLRPLESLCRLDYGWFLLNELRSHVGRADLTALESMNADASATTEELSASKKEAIRSSNALLAATQFSKARTAFGPLAPFPFQIFTLLQEARAQADAGRTQIGNAVLETALGMIDQFDPEHKELFSASVQKDAAWHYMIQWDFSQAEVHFLKSKAILDLIRSKPSLEFAPWIALFHVDHGLAMINRYRGNSEEALRQYRELTPRIAGKIRELDGSELIGQNYLEIRNLLGTRLCNSLERQGDCNFFSVKPNYAEAADDYRRAAIYAEAEQKPRYIFKRALAMTLQGEAEQVAYAGELIKRGKTEFERDEDRYVSFCCALADLLGKRQESIDTPPVDSSVCLESQLRELIGDYRDNFGAQIPRDDLELLMFASRTLLKWQRETAAAKVTASLKLDIERDADRLLALCRLAHQTTEVELQTLLYLRPYYEDVFRAKLTLGKPHIKELIEIAWEATQGHEFMKPPELNPLLVLFSIGDQQYFMLDNPSGRSELFVANEGVSSQQLIAASLDSSNMTAENAKLVFPDALRGALREFGKQTVAFQWRDASLGLGYNTANVLETRRGLPGGVSTVTKIEKNSQAVVPYQRVGEVTEYLDAPSLPAGKELPEQAAVTK